MTTDSDAPTDLSEVPAPARLIGLTSGAWVTQALSAVAALGVADHLADGPRTADDLAGVVGADGPSLHRVLRALTDAEVFDELDGRRFALTELSSLLRSDGPVSLRAWATMVGSPFHMRALTGLVGSVRTGEPAFERVHGQQAFDWFRDHPEEGALFNDAMTGASSPPIAEVMTACDFSDASLVVDVGGGHGSLLAAILQAHSHLKGVVFDLPEVVAGATPVLDEAGVSGRATVVAGDFFASVPSGGDVYVLANIIHDWDDERAVRILANCRAALGAGGRVLLGEAVLPDGPEPSLAKLIDVEMLVMGTGRQRSEQEYRQLFRAAGLDLVGIGPTGPAFSVVEARAAGPEPQRHRQFSVPASLRPQRLDPLLRGPAHVVGGRSAVPNAHVDQACQPRSIPTERRSIGSVDAPGGRCSKPVGPLTSCRYGGWMASIAVLAPDAASDHDLVGQLTDLVNRVYATAEEGLWVDGATRTTTDEMSDLIAAGEIALASVGDDIVGSVRIQQLDGATGEFGMLVAAPDRRGEGIGRDLIRFAEELSRRRDLAVMQLELLVPRTWTHPTKDFLNAWYTRIGYRPMRTGRIDDSYPDLAPLLATPCDFVIYQKDLGPPGPAS